MKSPVHIFIEKLNKIGVPVDNKSKNKIIVELGALDNESKEAYKLEVEKDKIIITASEPQGVFYGLMTIWQGLKFSDTNSIPCGIIHDEPRFEYRGFMLDESRHFFGKEKVFQLLDLMSIFKLNTFHWHLTDSPGWRIEIKAFPKLTTIGGKGNHTNPDAPVRYYTQGEINEIVSYAADRCITIIPEIDMPGHATAANKAYPEFSGGGSEKYPEFTFNPGKEETYAYLMAILKEVNDLFTAEESKLVKGIQANLWTERATTPQWIDFMTFPRMIALSEAAWTNEENKNYTRFEKFLPSIYTYLDESDIYYFNSLADTLRVEPAQ